MDRNGDVVDIYPSKNKPGQIFNTTKTNAISKNSFWEYLYYFQDVKTIGSAYEWLRDKFKRQPTDRRRQYLDDTNGEPGV